MTKTLKILPGQSVPVSVTGDLFERSFNEPFGAAAVADLTKSAATWSLVGVILENGLEKPVGFVIGMTVCDTSEIYSIGVIPEHRGQGFARALMEQAQAACAAAGAETVFLEVAADNEAAIGLYSRLGYQPNGRRKNYYRRGSDRIDAIMMAKTL